VLRSADPFYFGGHFKPIPALWVVLSEFFRIDVERPVPP
jgi:hypothetical protein